MGDIKPNHTIYIKNLNEKVKKQELNRQLHAIFTQFGEVLAVMSFRTERMRGQAHVVFKEISSASNAIRMLQGFTFYDKPLVINYAKGDSDIISKAKGTFTERAHKNSAIQQRKKKVYEKVEKGLPNKTLFVSNLPFDVEKSTLEVLFNQFPGYVDIRVPPKKEIAFVEFDSEELAAPAKSALDGFKITPDCQMKVEFSKK